MPGPLRLPEWPAEEAAPLGGRADRRRRRVHEPGAGPARSADALATERASHRRSRRIRLAERDLPTRERAACRLRVCRRTSPRRGHGREADRRPTPVDAEIVLKPHELRRARDAGLRRRCCAGSRVVRRGRSARRLRARGQRGLPPRHQLLRDGLRLAWRGAVHPELPMDCAARGSSSTRSSSPSFGVPRASLTDRLRQHRVVVENTEAGRAGFEQFRARPGAQLKARPRVRGGPGGADAAPRDPRTRPDRPVDAAAPMGETGDHARRSSTAHRPLPLVPSLAFGAQGGH